MPGALVAAWAAVTAVVPHFLHHVAPVLGGAAVAGVGGSVLFAALGLLLMIPFLVRLYRRFGTWLAPLAAVALFGSIFLASTLVIGPMVRGGLRPADGAGQPPSHGETHGH